MVQATPHVRPDVRIERFKDIDSTNAEALRRAAEGERGPLWIIAERQLAGRGRRGRPWVSDAGNLYASLLLSPRCEPRHAGQLAFVASLALYDAVCELAPAARAHLSLKWPNDLLLDDAKISGILIESAGSGSLDVVVIGCGINCTTHPSNTPYPATDLGARGYAVQAQHLADALVMSFDQRLLQWRVGAGFATIRADWLERAGGVGGPITVHCGDGSLSGVFEGLGVDGRLVLRLPGGSRRDILTGDVFFATQSITAKDN